MLVSGLFVVCTTPPVAVEEPQPEAVVAEVPVPHGGAVSQEVYDATLAEVKGFIDGLNQSITRRNFSEWRGALTDEHFAQISSAEFLAQASESPALRRGRIVLRTANDYFIYVVVPARDNSHVNEIEIDPQNGNRVRAYYNETRTRRGQTETRRLLLYDLVKVGGNWKITITN